MGDDKKESSLPVRALHDFLFELSKDWDNFRTGSLLSIVVSVVVLILFTPRFLVLAFRREGPVDALLVVGIVAALIYNVYLGYSQHSFYRRWERRIGLLMHLEDQLLGDEKRD